MLWSSGRICLTQLIPIYWSQEQIWTPDSLFKYLFLPLYAFRSKDVNFIGILCCILQGNLLVCKIGIPVNWPWCVSLPDYVINMICFLEFSVLSRKRRCQVKDRGLEESNHYDSEWWKTAWASDDHYTLCAASSRSYYQKTAACLLGDSAKDHSRWQASARNDPRVRCIQKGGLLLILFLMFPCSILL